jgi:hypothetical protein
VLPGWADRGRRRGLGGRRRASRGRWAALLARGPFLARGAAATRADCAPGHVGSRDAPPPPLARADCAPPPLARAPPQSRARASRVASLPTSGGSFPRHPKPRITDGGGAMRNRRARADWRGSSLAPKCAFRGICRPTRPAEERARGSRAAVLHLVPPESVSRRKARPAATTAATTPARRRPGPPPQRRRPGRHSPPAGHTAAHRHSPPPPRAARSQPLADPAAAMPRSKSSSRSSTSSRPTEQRSRPGAMPACFSAAASSCR